jgi:hypothetical protein
MFSWHKDSSQAEAVEEVFEVADIFLICPPVAHSSTFAVAAVRSFFGFTQSIGLSSHILKVVR